MILQNYGGMNDMSWLVFLKLCEDLNVSKKLTYGQLRDLFLAFLMQGAENLPELQAYLTWYDAPADAKEGPPADGKKHPLPQIPLDDVPRLLACIGVLPNMEEPDDQFIATGVDQFYTRVALAKTHATDLSLAQKQSQKADAAEDGGARGARRKTRRSRKISGVETADSKQMGGTSTLEPKVNWLGKGGDASRASGLVSKGSLAGLALDDDAGVDLARVKEADLRAIRTRHGWI